MKLSYLIDTDWIIHYLNGNSGIVEKIGLLEKEGLAASVISVAELYEGIYYSTNPAGNEKALRFEQKHRCLELYEGKTERNAFSSLRRIRSGMTEYVK